MLVTLHDPDPPPLKLAPSDKKALRDVFDEAKDWARQNAKRYKVKPNDAALPAAGTAAGCLIAALEGALLSRVESMASRAIANGHADDVKLKIQQLNKQRKALTVARDTICEVGRARRAGAEIEQRSMAAGATIGDAVAAAVTVLDETDAHLAAQLDQLRALKHSRGKPVDSWRAALIETLGEWWRGQGWKPTAKRDHAFAGVLCVLLDARARRDPRHPAKSARRNLRRPSQSARRRHWNATVKRLSKPLREAQREWERQQTAGVFVLKDGALVLRRSGPTR